MRIIGLLTLAILALGLTACQGEPEPINPFGDDSGQTEEVTAPPVRQTPAPTPAPERRVEAEPPASAPAAPAEAPPASEPEPEPEPVSTGETTRPPATSFEAAQVRRQMVMAREAFAAKDAEASVQHLEDAVALVRASGNRRGSEQVTERLPELLEMSQEFAEGMERPDTDEQEAMERRMLELEADIMQMMEENL